MLGRAALNSFHQLVGSLVKAQFMARESSKKAGDNFPALHTQARENLRTKMIEIRKDNLCFYLIKCNNIVQLHSGPLL